MYLVTAVLKPHRLEAVTNALKALDVSGLTISEAQGFGRQRGHTEVYRGSEYRIDYVPKVRLDIVCDGRIGDGKIWITEVTRLVRIRTGEVGPDAL
jgi:nitrogen regulatory protein P-II 1